jgi:hypothetical protein
MAKITYLLGAGASYNALPIVNQMYSRMTDTILWFETSSFRALSTLTANGHIIGPNPNNNLRIKKILTDLKWLQEQCNTEKNFSIDTFARKLDLSGNKNDYIKLKNILSLYFTLEQRRKLPDVRYDNFWASILKSATEFPNNINILSWNYDFQLELTYQDFFGHDSLKASRELLNIASQETDLIDLPDSGQFGIFKLNGSATFDIKDIANRDTKYLIDKFKSSDMAEFITQAMETYENLCEKSKLYINHLSFAWEHKTGNAFYKCLKESVCNTEILVVIGYSFPFFNRDIDKLILNEYMSDTLRKVYFQSPDAEDIRERFLAINDSLPTKDLVLRKDIKQFTLPNEL